LVMEPVHRGGKRSEPGGKKNTVGREFMGGWISELKQSRLTGQGGREGNNGASLKFSGEGEKPGEKQRESFPLQNQGEKKEGREEGKGGVDCTKICNCRLVPVQKRRRRGEKFKGKNSVRGCG